MRVEGRKIAIIEDDPVMGESLVQCLTLEGAQVEWFSSASTALNGLRGSKADLAICDIRLPDMDGQRLFHQAVRMDDAPPFLFMTAYSDVSQAVALMREGAADYVVKPFDFDDFMDRVQNALRRSNDWRATETLGVSPQMQAVEHMLYRVAKLKNPVLLTGETGVGKEVCAKYLHGLSAPKSPFVALNCAAIPPDLLESELFGHEQGAFTGANRRHIGYAERSQAGTLFLDEIGELALPLQAKLLRVLEERTFHRVGGEAALLFKARIICATNADLEARVAAKQFREDLFFRINVIAIPIPPLRERQEDIPLLMHNFLEACKESGKQLRGFSELTEVTALMHPWPGNVRELKNRVERAAALAPGEWIMPGDMFPQKSSPNVTSNKHNSLADARDAVQKHRIELALAENKGQIGKTATALGISRTTLWDKMRRYKISDAAR